MVTYIFDDIILVYKLSSLSPKFKKAIVWKEQMIYICVAKRGHKRFEEGFESLSFRIVRFFLNYIHVLLYIAPYAQYFLP